MSLLATLSDLMKGCPRNIKRRLLRDILLILFVTSGAILAIVLIQDIKTQRDTSSAIISEANKQVSTHFQSFTDPIGNTLKLLGKWGETGLLNLNNPELIATQFQALMEIQPIIHSISLADTKENDIRLSHSNNGWLLDEFSKSVATTSRWLNGKIEDKRTIINDRYNMSTTTWFRGAMVNQSNVPFFLTEPYLQKSSGETVITASLRWARRTDPTNIHVSAISFTIKDLMVFIEQLRITPNSRIALYEKDGSLLNTIKSNTSLTGSPATSQETQLSEQLLTKVGKHLILNRSNTNQATSIKDNGKTWWLGLSSLYATNDDVWVAVLIPEDDIFSDLHQQWLRFGLIVSSIFLTGVIMTVLLVRRYSHRLKDLPQQHIASQGYETEVKELIRAGESTTLEFKSTMRTNLKSGKPGKEIEIAWLKTVAAFMNSDGGILLIGVDDDGKILGTADDQFENEDKCRLHFKNMLNTHIGAEFTRFIHLKIVEIQEKTILIVECERVRRPVFLSIGKQEYFYIRSGPSSMKLSMSQMIKYLGER